MTQSALFKCGNFHGPFLLWKNTNTNIVTYMQVGGDGLFSEVLNGTIMLWAEGGDRAAAAGSLRLGHIPAGSTDAVAYSLNGTRSPSTAALHIALGDR